jgi:outer membrane receptor protein involved in Fe transport
MIKENKLEKMEENRTVPFIYLPLSMNDIFNVRVSYQISNRWQIYARIINITDELYAERASKSGSDSALYAPGQPQTYFVGLVYKWGEKK